MQVLKNMFLLMDFHILPFYIHMVTVNFFTFKNKIKYKLLLTMLYVLPYISLYCLFISINELLKYKRPKEGW